jgi:aerotaxis receptor
MPAKPNVEPIDIEVTFEDEMLEARGLITRTDLKGIITYTSKAYRQMTKYDKEELIGKPHSIVRHPDMPAAAFKQMWDTIKQDKVWEGYVKNLRKDGKYYWVIVRIEPVFDENGEKIGYTGLRREPDRATIEEIEERYKEMLKNE